MNTATRALTSKSALPLFLVALLSFAPPAISADDSRSGEFKGLSDHSTTGTATVMKTDSGYIIKLGADFTFSGAPDPKVGWLEQRVIDVG